MKWLVMVMVMVWAGVASGQEPEPFPFTKEEWAKGINANSPEEAKFAAWLFRNADLKPELAAVFGVHKEAGLVVMASNWKDHKEKFGKPEAGNKYVALELGVMVVTGEHSPNPLYVKVQCSGAVYEVSMMATPPKPKLGTTSIMAGESTKGWVVVEVPASATAETCKWAWDIPIAGRTKWLTIPSKK